MVASWGLHPWSRLPVDVLVSLLSWIDGHVTLFSLLDAMGSADVRGPLEPLWQLGTLISRKVLWPQLQLVRSLVVNPTLRVAVEAALPLCTNVRVDWADDIAWLEVHLRTSMTVEWCARLPISQITPIPLDEWYSRWARLPLAKVHLASAPRFRVETFSVPHFRGVLPQCQQLVSLDLSGDVDVDTIFGLAASTTSLTHLAVLFKPTPACVTPATLQSLLQWLHTTQVQEFRMLEWYLSVDVDPIDRDTLYSLLFQTHPTLRELMLGYCPLSDLDVPSLSPSLRTLHLAKVGMTSLAFQRLIDAIRHSCLTTLRLESMTKPTPEDFLNLLPPLVQAVSQSTVTTLTLDDCGILDSTLKAMCPWLTQATSLRHLSLNKNVIYLGIKNLALAIQGHPALHSLSLDGNNIDVSGVQALLSTSDSQDKPPTLHTLNLKNNGLYWNSHKAKLENLAAAKGITLILN
ncbi:Aste57867_2380 [Aphanomyces stellatus]|uniref:Aste57867_2380 protein n=1 Tax=Aphanomyces stellatus TaxID=120398 RepID=A0A485KA00_9STRA|nr:hypothetical protein As57867_002374 [Aphanomyces stellatus]VFT79581.1 Aste57867_2380 [Aphanomyces stellatus]